MRKQRDGGNGKGEKGDDDARVDGFKRRSRIARTALKDVDRAMRDRRLKTSTTRYIERGV